MGWTEVLALVWSMVGTILTGLATWGTAALIQWLNTKIKDKQLAKWATDITTLVSNSVKTVFQTYVEALKKEGAFTLEKQKEALEKCLQIIKNELPKELSDYITENFGDLDTYLKGLIESTIYTLKIDGKKEVVVK